MSDRFKYSVRVKNGAGWRKFNRIRLMISVGQQYHEGSKLEAVVDWINRNPSIKEIHISVNDYLQRHNYYARGIGEERSNAIALAEGTLWIERNYSILADIQAKINITRWNDWYDSNKYKAAFRTIDDLAHTDLVFRKAINSDAVMLAARKANRGELIPSSLIAYSAEYLREELAVFAVQATQSPAAEIYPGSNLSSAEYLLGKSLPEPIMALAQRHFTRIDFARINLQPVNDPHIALEFAKLS